MSSGSTLSPAGATGADSVIPNFVGGEWVPSGSTDVLDVTDPGTGELLGRVPRSTAADVAEAVRAAADAFPAWRATPAVERVRVLFRLKALLEDHKAELARDLSREHGKNLNETLGEIQRGIENVEHACGIPTLMMGDTLEDVASGIDCETVRQPLGVFAGITPYNFPIMIPLWFWPYAVATGNTFILKPSEQDPLTHQKVVDLAVRAGLPPGVLNVVHGDKDVSSALLEHPDVKAVSFVGSTPVARAIYERGTAHGKRVQALGGAKNHMVVLPDADIGQAADAAVSAGYGSAGERCMAISAVVAVGDVGDRLVPAIAERIAALRVGPGTEDVDMGPLVSQEHRDRVTGYVDAGLAVGAELVADGRVRRLFVRVEHPAHRVPLPVVARARWRRRATPGPALQWRDTSPAPGPHGVVCRARDRHRGPASYGGHRGLRRRGGGWKKG
jgi:malonate-semialdehyde dehydrogenase (acetylating) / methylmalonate-semialdehyde dehydrogenase